MYPNLRTTLRSLPPYELEAIECVFAPFCIMPRPPQHAIDSPLCKQDIESLERYFISELSLLQPLFDEEGLEAFQDFLLRTTTLERLALGVCKLCETGVLSIFERVLPHTQLQALCLHNANVGDAGATRIAAALHKNRTIHSLRISHGRELMGKQRTFADRGAAAMAELVLINPVITCLDFRGNEIGDVGAEEFARALRSNGTLTSLRLSDNEISEAGAVQLAEAMKDNTAVVELDLKCTPVLQRRIGELCQKNLRPHVVLSLQRSISQGQDGSLLLRFNTMSGASHEVKVLPEGTYQNLRAEALKSLDPSFDAENRPLSFVLPNGKKLQPGITLASALMEQGVDGCVCR